MTYCTFLEGDQAEAYKKRKELMKNCERRNYDDEAADDRYYAIKNSRHRDKYEDKIHNHNMKHPGKNGYEENIYAHDAMLRHDRRHPDRKIAEAGIFANIDLI